MNSTRLVWLIFPVALVMLSLTVFITGANTSKLLLGIIMLLCVLACVRQGFLFRTKGQTLYEFVAFTAAATTLVFFAISLVYLQ